MDEEMKKYERQMNFDIFTFSPIEFWFDNRYYSISNFEGFYTFFRYHIYDYVQTADLSDYNEQNVRFNVRQLGFLNGIRGDTQMISAEEYETKLRKFHMRRLNMTDVLSWLCKLRLLQENPQLNADFNARANLRF